MYTYIEKLALILQAREKEKIDTRQGKLLGRISSLGMGPIMNEVG